MDKCKYCYRYDPTGQTDCAICDFQKKHIESAKVYKAIVEIKELYTEWENSTDDARLESNPFGAVLNIIQRNIGE